MPLQAAARDAQPINTSTVPSMPSEPVAGIHLPPQAPDGAEPASARSLSAETPLIDSNVQGSNVAQPVDAGIVDALPTSSTLLSSSAPPSMTVLPPAASRDGDNGEAAAVQRTEEARAAFLGALHSVGSHTDADLQMRAHDIQVQSAQLAAQETQVQQSTFDLARATDGYQRLLDDSHRQLREFGDVQNWAELLQRDLLVLEETLRIVDAEAAASHELETDSHEHFEIASDVQDAMHASDTSLGTEPLAQSADGPTASARQRSWWPTLRR